MKKSVIVGVIASLVALVILWPTAELMADWRYSTGFAVYVTIVGVVSAIGSRLLLWPRPIDYDYYRRKRK